MNNNNSQEIALELTKKYLNQNQYKNIKIEKFKNNLIFINCFLNEKNYFIIPTYHDYLLESKFIYDFYLENQTKICLISLTSPDGTCILYEISNFNLNEISDNDSYEEDLI